MRDLLVIGLTHRSAPVEVREQLAVGTEALPEALAALGAACGASEAMLLSTCNRTEVVAAAGEAEDDAARIRAFLAGLARRPPGDLDPFLHEHRGRDAVRHLFRVAASLDSMVPGESQILGQVRAALAAARAGGLGRGVVGRAAERALVVAKRVRTQTAIGRNPISVSSVAVDLARTIFGDLAGRSVLLVGAGKMGRLTLKHLRAAGVHTVYLANRSAERAAALLAEVEGGIHVPPDRLLETLEKVDIALSAARPAGGFVIDRAGVRGLDRRRRARPLFLVDIAVPRSIDPETNQEENVFLYDIDDLRGVVEDNLRGRAREAQAAEAIVEAEAEAFLLSVREVDVGPTIRALGERLDRIRVGEIARLGARLGPAERQAVEVATRAVLNKVAHGAIVELKRAAADPEGAPVIEALRRALVPEAPDAPVSAAAAAAESPVPEEASGPERA